MEKKLSDYIHFYLNPFHKTKILVDGEHEMFLWDLEFIPDMDIVHFTAAPNEFKGPDIEDDGEWQLFNDTEELTRMKLFLRPLSDMTEEDLQIVKDIDLIPEFTITHSKYGVEIDSITYDGFCLNIYSDGSMDCFCKDNRETYPYQGPIIFTNLLKKGFDLFGLIESGLAINKSKE